MFGIKYIRFQPSQYALRYRNGKITQSGAGIAFYCYLPKTTVAMLPVGSQDVPFVSEEMTSDYQSVTLQGQAVYRISDFNRASEMFDFTYNLRRSTYFNDDSRKLSKRIADNVRVYAKQFVQRLTLAECVKASMELTRYVFEQLRESETIMRCGVEILDISFAEVRPNAETARALEAVTRESLLKVADDATYERRNSAIDQERKVRENEYNTEIAVETKRRQVEETKMDAEQALQRKRAELANEQLTNDLALRTQELTHGMKAELDSAENQVKVEEVRGEYSKLKSENDKLEAEVQVYMFAEMMRAYGAIDAGVAEALASSGMQSDKILALAFRNLAENAGKIGQLNITPDLLSEFMSRPERSPQ